MGKRRQSTETSTFGAGRRESHDASAFYERFPAPEISDAQEVPPPTDFLEPAFFTKDARHMDEVRDGSVALVVTSPPYFAGKEYEEELGKDGVPGSYLEYLQFLHEVFAECARKLEPGGRMAVNVANLGRKPYRSLSADVIRILQDELHLLLRGEVIWQKAKGAAGNVAWGSYQSAANPVLRDLTERVIIASKGRFDRARSIKKRAAEGLPHRTHTTADEFAAATLDVWNIAPESAQRVGHPAPFPVALPLRLIRLYTYEQDLVLDPFLGSGTTLVAAVKEHRRGVGYDLDAGYVEAARERVRSVMNDLAGNAAPVPQALPPPAQPSLPPANFQARSTYEGKNAKNYAKSVLERAGFTILRKKYRPRGAGVEFSFLAADKKGAEWYVDVSGAFTVSERGGLLRTDTLWRTLGKALVLREHLGHPPRLLLLTSHLPRPGLSGHKALHQAGRSSFWDAIEMATPEGFERLSRYSAGDLEAPLPGFWTEDEVAEVP